VPSNTYVAPPQSQRFRKLTWDAAIPIAVTVETNDLAKLGSNVNRAIETHYVKAPRISYLPLLLQEIKTDLLALMLDASISDTIKDEDYCFTYEGTPLRWHWPIGLLYDYHTANTAPTMHTRIASTSQPNAAGGVQTLTASLRRLSTAPASVAAAEGPTSNGQGSYKTNSAAVPWSITLRIGAIPMEKLHSVPGVSNCRSSFMSMVKEADFVRHGSTKRVTNLRRTEQDALWEGVMQHDFDVYWSVAEKVMPSASVLNDELAATSGLAPPSRTPSFSSTNTAPVKSILTHHHNESLSSLHSAAASESGVSTAETASTTKTIYRSVPMRFHLSNGAPVVQEPAAPFTEDGRAITLHIVLSSLFPLLFPPTPTFSTAAATGIQPAPLAYAVIQGIRVPLEAEIAWIGSVLPYADGW
jgi:autophagy-related protein 5